MPFVDLRATNETAGVAVTASNPGEWVFGYRDGSSEVLVWRVNTNGTVTFVGTVSVTDLTVTDDLTVQGDATVEGALTSNGALVANGTVLLNAGGTIDGNLTVTDDDAAPTKAYRFRTSGSELDVDFGGTSANFSTFANADFTGTQRFYLALDSTQNIARAVRRWQFSATDPFGTVNVAIDGASGIELREGANAKMGTAVLVAGAATVATTAVAADSRVFLTSQADGGTPGFLRVSARVAGTSFTITSSSGTDTSTVAWVILDPV